MPKPTFLNLPDDKRQKIIDIAIDEFVEHGFRGASISRIVDAAGIAKGSFYQYFEDKEDLFGYLLDEAMRLKQAFLAKYPPTDPSQDIFEYLRWLFKVGVSFELENPKLARLAYRAALGQDPLPERFNVDAQAATRDFYRQLIRRSIAQGHLRDDVDEDMIIFVFSATSSQLGKYIADTLDLSPDQIIDVARDTDVRDQMSHMFDSLLDILKYGIAAGK